MEAGRGGPGGERRLIALLILASVGGLMIANHATRNRPIYCPACRTAHLYATHKSIRFTCRQCAAEFTRVGVVMVRQGVDGAEEEDRIPNATAKLKPKE